MRCSIAMLALLPIMVASSPGPDPSKSATGRDGANLGSGQAERDMTLTGKPQPTSRPAPDNGVTDAELEENQRRANDPNYVPDPDDPDSCAGGCVMPHAVPDF
jgi:hypothetical protein